ncbi:helix-turn-helix transcriptional regulator [Sphingomonas sp. BK580]|uniref:helix-turn-helix domain-containing protein n=1 Tax=Sphingomonas sp. BK580 TaxID=2586972 RepID=UPI00161C7437
MQFNDRLCKAARALLDWTAEDLAKAASIGVATIRRFETGAEIRAETSIAIQGALETGGVEFVEAGATMRPGKSAAGPGVRLRA